MPEYDTIEKIRLPRPFNNRVNKASYKQFLNSLCKRNDIEQAVFTLPFSGDDPLKYLDGLDPRKEFLFYWEKPESTHSIAAGGSLLNISESGSNRFLNTHKAMEAEKNKTLHFNGTSQKEIGINFLGGFSFFDKGEEKQWQYFDAASLTLARRVIIKKGNDCSISVALALAGYRMPEQIHHKLQNELKRIKNIAPSANYSLSSNGYKPNPSANISNPSCEQWERSIAEAKKQMADKKLEKVVIARELNIASNKPYEPATILHRLRSRYPKCSTFLVLQNSSDLFIGCSPERLLSFQGNLLQTEALAGSIARGTTHEEDTDLEKKLMNSSKNIAEHNFVIKDIEQLLQPFVQKMNKDTNLKIKKLANVQHLLTSINAEMEPDITPLSIIDKLHPTPAVGGYPQKKAFQYIAKKESFNRGWFGAPVGWINTEGAGEFTVAIRSGLVGKKTARLFAGCGIVAESDAESEWQESNLKFIPMLSALNHG